MIIVILAFGLLGGIVSTIAARDIIWDRTKKSWMKLNTHGLVFVFCTIVLILLPLVQFYIQNKIDDQKEVQRKKDEQDRDDTLRNAYNRSIVEMKGKFDKSSSETISNIVAILAKYGYRLDTTNERLSKIVTEPDPMLSVSSSDNPKGISFLKEENGVSHYKVTFVSLDASSCCFQFKVNVVVQDSTGELDYMNMNGWKIGGNTCIDKDRSESWYFNIISNTYYNYLYVWIRGTYKNLDESKTFTVDEIVYNNKNGNVCGNIIGPTRDSIISLINRSKN